MYIINRVGEIFMQTIIIFLRIKFENFYFYILSYCKFQEIEVFITI